MKSVVGLIDELNNDNNNNRILCIGTPFIIVPLLKYLYYYYKYQKVKNQRSLKINDIHKGLTTLNPDKYFKWVFRKLNHSQIKAKNQIIEGYI